MRSRRHPRVDYYVGMGGGHRFELTGLERNRACTLTETEARELYSELRQAFEDMAAEETSNDD
jgi:hypothetical protein